MAMVIVVWVLGIGMFFMLVGAGGISASLWITGLEHRRTSLQIRGFVAISIGYGMIVSAMIGILWIRSAEAIASLLELFDAL